MTHSGQDDQIDRVVSIGEKTSEPSNTVKRTQSKPVRSYKIFEARSCSPESKSCPVIDDRSNSASPTRRQPIPSGMMAYRGFFGQRIGQDERIREWPPPEPRIHVARPVMPNITALFLPRPTPLHNPNVWFFGPTANVQQIVYEEVPESIDETTPTLQNDSQGSQPNPTATELSLVTVEEDMLTSTDSHVPREVVNINQTEISMSGEPHSMMSEARETTNQTDDLSLARRDATDGEGILTDLPGISTVPEADEVHNVVRIQQQVIQAPPQQLFFIIVDTNEGGPDRNNDRVEVSRENFAFGVRQRLPRLSSYNGD